MPSYVTYHIFAATVQRVTSDSVAHIASSYPAAYRWGSQGADPLALYHAPFPSALRRLANRVCTEPPAPLFESLCKAAVASHNTAALAYVFGFCTHYALSRVTYSFVSAQADRLSQFMPGYSAEARRHLVESDIDGVMIADFVSDTPAVRSVPSTGAGCARVPSRGENSGAGPAGDVRRAHHACRRLPLDERYAPHAPSRASGCLCAQPSAAVRAPDRQIRFCVLAYPSDRAALGGLHQSGAPSVDIPHRRANGFVLRSV